MALLLPEDFARLPVAPALERLGSLGSGGFGSVVEVRSTLTQERYAAKIMDFQDSTCVGDAARREIEMHENLRKMILQLRTPHRFIVPYVGAYRWAEQTEEGVEGRPKLCILMRAASTSLFNLIYDNRVPSDAAWYRFVKKMTYQVLSALQFIHASGYGHLDLKRERGGKRAYSGDLAY